MEVYINNEIFSISASVNLFDFLTSRNVVDKLGIAVAVNNQVIPKTQWQDYLLHHQDKIIIIRATQGG